MAGTASYHVLCSTLHLDSEATAYYPLAFMSFYTTNYQDTHFPNTSRNANGVIGSHRRERQDQNPHRVQEAIEDPLSSQYPKWLDQGPSKVRSVLSSNVPLRPIRLGRSLLPPSVLCHPLSRLRFSPYTLILVPRSFCGLISIGQPCVSGHTGT